MRLEFLGFHHWRWCLRVPLRFDRIERHTANGIRWYARLLFWSLTRFQPCACDKER